MHRNRLVDLEVFELLPTAPGLDASARAFVVCPMVLTQCWGWGPCPWMEIYRTAYERAQAVLRPSRLERLQDEVELYRWDRSLRLCSSFRLGSNSRPDLSFRLADCSEKVREMAEACISATVAAAASALVSRAAGCEDCCPDFPEPANARRQFLQDTQEK